MINIIESRIKMTKKLIRDFEEKKSSGLIGSAWDNGYISGLKAQLTTLEELLTSAKELKRLSA